MAIRAVPQTLLETGATTRGTGDGIAGGTAPAAEVVLLDGVPVPVAADHRPLWYRLSERLAALFALIVFAPLMLVVAILIRFDSPGPVFFTQQRVTTGGRQFTFIKFRSMLVDGNRRFPAFAPEALQRQQTETLHLSVPDDPRVTRFGAWLRRSSVDEIPNFLHVLAGDMALVGPRPEMPEYLVHYGAGQMAKFSVPPGITGYAQIYGRGELSFSETLDFDLAYVRERSVRVDFRVLVRTIRGVLAHKGAF